MVCFVVVVVVVVFCLFRATPEAYGGSQVRGLIGATAATATAIRILNTLSEARDQTRNLMVPSRILFCCAMMGTPRPPFERQRLGWPCTLF